MNLFMLPKEETVGETAGTAFSNNFQQAFGSGIQALANMKMQDYMNRQQMALQREAQNYKIGQQANFWKSMGLPDQMASSIAQADPAVQKSLLDRLEGINLPLAQQQSLSQTMQQPANILPETQNIQKEQPEIKTEQEGYRIGLNPIERRHKEDMELKRQQFEFGKGKEEFHKLEKADARFRPKYNEIIDKARKNRELDATIDKMIDFNNSGTLPDENFVNFVEKMSSGMFGAFINANNLLGPNAEEYKKLSNLILNSAKSVFGSRLTDRDVALFMQRIPTLVNTPEGRAEILRDLKMTNELANKEADIAIQIEKENNDLLPASFNRKLEKRMKPVLHDFKKEFLKSAKPKEIRTAKTLEEFKNVSQGQIATNKKTGKKAIYKGVKWHSI